MPYVIIFIALAMPAQAYVDPNTGGVIMQILTPLLLMLGVAWTAVRRNIVAVKKKVISFFLAIFGKNSNE